MQRILHIHTNNFAAAQLEESWEQLKSTAATTEAGSLIHLESMLFCSERVVGSLLQRHQLSEEFFLDLVLLGRC